MSKQNVELHRRALEAFNSRDWEAAIANADPSIELHSAMTVPGGAVYHGHDGVRKYIRDMEEAWGEEIPRAEPEAFFDLGEYTLAFAVVLGRGQQSGAEVGGPVTHVARWRDGRCVYFKFHLKREDALEELGVSEDALEPIAP